LRGLARKGSSKLQAILGPASRFCLSGRRLFFSCLSLPLQLPKNFSRIDEGEMRSTYQTGADF